MLRNKLLLIILILAIIQPVISYSPPNLSISLDKTTLIANENNLVYLTIRNTGDATALQIWMAISLPASTGSSLMILNGSDGRWYIDSLASNEWKSIPMVIYVSPIAAGGIYQITFTISYQYYGTRTETRSIGVYVPPIESKGAQLSLEVNSYELRPGTINNITLKVRNIGDLDARQISLIWASTISTISLIGSDGKWIIDIIKAGDEYIIPLSIYAGSSFGQYQIPISLSYYDSIKSRTETRYLTFIIPITISPYVDFELSLMPQELRANDVNKLTILIRNNGDGSAKSVQINLITTGLPMALLNSDGKWLINEVLPNETIKIEASLYVSPSASGTYQLTLSISYYDSLSRMRQENYYLTVKVKPSFSPISLIDLNLSNSILKSGEINEIDLIVKNVGDSEVNALTISTSLPTGAIAFIETDGYFHISKLKPNESICLPLKIFASPSASGSLISMMVTASYYDETGRSKQQTSSLGLIVKGTPNFIILDTYVYPAQISLGSPFSLTVSMINLGTATAQSMIIYPNSLQNIRPVSDEKIFIGDVTVNVPTSFTISYIADKITDGKYVISINYTYRDSLGQTYRGTMEIPFQISIKQQSTTSIAQSSPNPYNFYITFIILLIGIMSAIIVYRRRRS
ncbi:MAG: hypothetical protein NZ922_06705 [Candidatus Methanomethyliaceae archaeon]|nr:hypothetical protein [Candidatus Methanomethyliaceae archaeon]MDW7970573.1 CARDB domain-containing protein [Nitrososphaerota archaeon]